MRAMELFLADYDAGRSHGRYVDAALPGLPFPDGAFDLALCSHYLFLYSAQVSEALHVASVREMCRVASEVRIFPLIALGGARSPHLWPCLHHLAEAGYHTSIELVPYEFQRGGNEMLRIPVSRQAVEEIHDAGLERILGADDEQSVVLDQLLEHLRAVAQVVGRRADVGAHGRAHQRVAVVPRSVSSRLSTDGRTRFDDRAQVARLLLGGPRQLLERRLDGAALRVAEHHDETRPEPLGGELHAAHLRRRHDVAGDADDEEIAEALIEDDLRRHPRVGAAEDDGERFLVLRQRAAGAIQHGQAGRESLVTGAQPVERLRRGNHEGGPDGIERRV